ncbi:Putative aflatoxin regulatory protein [Colletotrichum destructivum]|uniref:Aflatoxin regulatory protein n=1 Tax=Colletotrichum destructivum TaxID=34406 RepID=A0AAX4IYU3_9PEZI|nr:Putative aflatoxin regulatory protein [Colletotrichum destructivum]
MAPGSRSDYAGHETKLRNSCDTCATAKIKCTQQKPACAYCVKRLKTCVYGASKRVRRTQRSHKQQHQQQHTLDVGRSPKPTAAATTTTAWPQGAKRAASFPPPDTVFEAEIASSQHAFAFTAPPMTGHQDWPDFLTALISPSITSSSSSAEHFTSSELESVGVSLESFTYVEDSTFSSLTPLSRLSGDHRPIRTRGQAFSHGSSSVDSAASTKDVRLGLLTENHGSSAAETSFFLPSPWTDAGAAPSNSLGTPDGHVRPQSGPGPPRCHCFARMLQFMAQLSTDPSQAWSAAPDDGDPHRPANLGIIDGRIAKMSDSISKVIQCPCSRDSEMIVLLSLVIFKIQVCYVDAVSAATCDNAGGGGPGSVVSCFPWKDTTNNRDEDDGEEDSDEEDQHRVFVQHILSRLAGLRALITRLSKRLAEFESESFPGASRWPTLPQGPSYYSVVEGRIKIMPFSASSLGGLSSDLQKRLSGMSQAISGKLQELQEG